MAVCLGIASSVFSWWSGHIERSVACLVVTITLVALRRQFRMGSSRPALSLALRRVATAVTVALLYGTAGFWLLEAHHFGQNFHWWQAAGQTVRALLLLGDTGLDPLTPHAARFLDSLFWMSAAVFAYCGVILFKPVAYHFFDNLSERERASRIAAEYGRTGQDFFKQWPDKTLFFSRSGQSFLAYRVANGFALTLGDPVGPEADLPFTIKEFLEMCRQRGWKAGFHQVRGDLLPTYEKLGLRGLKIGDEAVVDLNRFTLQGSAMKESRNTVTRLERAGYRVQGFDPRLDENLLDQLQIISDDWLALPGHRERRFTLGAFSRDYLRHTRVYVAFDASDAAVAFLNLVPSYDASLATVDLMRRGHDTTNGLMDFLFAKAFLDLKQRGCQRFSLGLAPLAQFSDGEQPSPEEKLVQWGLQRLPRLFRADSLRRFKAKYASEWQPRYEVYASRWDLPRLALALRNITEIRKRAA
jgi:phosphatidylglycerol lysyltransferase